MLRKDSATKLIFAASLLAANVMSGQQPARRPELDEAARAYEQGIVLLIAQVSARLEFYEDSAAYDRYLSLKPSDDAARRERGFVLALSNQSENALRDIEW